MKYSTVTLAALLAAQAQAQAQTPTSTQDVYKREAQDIAQDLQGFLSSLAAQQKRDVVDATPADIEEILKRAVKNTPLGEFLARRDVDWSSIIQSILSALPGLIKTIWDSGIIQQVVSAIWNNQSIRDALFNGIKWNDPSLSARDVGDTIGQIITSIWNSGVIQSVYNWVVNWIKNNPDQFQNLIKQGFNIIVSIGSSLWTWAQQNGIIEKVFTWIGNNAGGIIKTVVDFLLSLFGGASTGGSASASAGTKPTTTAAAPAATTQPAAAPAGTTQPAAAPAGTTAAAGGNNAVLASLQAAYGGGAAGGAAAPTTVQAKRMLY
ncbi:hypothetical protein DIURU_002007 [Diutina rugosa]|uniref:Opaque-phase-specific protein OP4 n=1 Tax=Diutina rugosa TaxID=5481 RepID=A0A642URC7_DIURU|nr:uncharacterized protein DIURU_002007 [Diutina rugosa]KAA8904055.1 hypothetical protein DIURU_002007 [Diutina rugosa]